MEYNKENLKLVSDCIKRNLTPDLLPKNWIERNSVNPMAGHCHTATGCLYKIFGSKNIKLYRVLDDEKIWHWWAVDRSCNLIDLTSEQYTSIGKPLPIYENGELIKGLLGWDYIKRVMILYERVSNELIT